MNELITINEGVALLSPETSARIAECERRIKEIKEAEDALRQAILEEMESKGIKSLETDEIQISYIAESDRETFDSKKFRAEHADLFDEYVKFTTTKASVRIKVKENPRKKVIEERLKEIDSVEFDIQMNDHLTDADYIKLRALNEERKALRTELESL